MEVLRTPDERFANLPGYDFQPNYEEINGLRMHYLDEGNAQLRRSYCCTANLPGVICTAK